MLSITTQNREKVYLEGQRLRAAESSRHEISELAYELLQRRLDERRATNERTNIEERARVENEHSSNLAELAAAHEKETAEFKDAEFTMIAEFDTQRDKLPGATLAMKLHAEGLKHAEFIDSLQAKLAEDNQAAEKELQAAVEAYEKARCKKLNCPSCTSKAPDIAETRRQAEQSTLERRNTYKKLVEHHQSEWKMRQEALRLELDTPAARQLRLNLEHDFQLRFAECGQSLAVIQKRQAKELNVLEENRDLAFAKVQERHECAEDELYVERCRVEESWKHLCDETVTARGRIDEDEKGALAELGQDETGETVASAEVTQAAKMVTRAVAHFSEDVEEVKTVGTVLPSEEKAAAACHTPGEEESDAGLPISIIPPAPADDTGDPAGSSLSSASPGHLSQPSVFDPQYDTAADGALLSGAERYTTLVNPFAHAERQIVITSQFTHSEPVGSVPDRSGSPDSAGSDSDFVEI